MRVVAPANLARGAISRHHEADIRMGLKHPGRCTNQRLEVFLGSYARQHADQFGFRGKAEFGPYRALPSSNSAAVSSGGGLIPS